jgi:hypothetical protein
MGLGSDPTGGNEDHEPHEWVVVGTFPQSVDLVYIEAALEDAGIRYFKKDELTIQVVPYLSQALGGVRVLVHTSDRDAALAIFKESGIELEDDPIGSPLLIRFEALTENLPLLGRLSLGWRFVAVVLAVLVPISILLHWRSLPNTAELLSEGMWCVTWMEVDGEPVVPNSTGALRIVFSGCGETVSFTKNGGLGLPGLSTPPPQAMWTLESKDRLRIQYTDSFASVYDGLYAVWVTERELAIRSQRVYLIAEKHRWDLPF